MYSKDSPLVKKLKEWVDEMYADGRTTVLSNSELERKILEITDLSERKGSVSINQTTNERTDLWGIH